MMPISSSSIFVKKIVQHGPITSAIDCNGLSLLIFEEKCTSYVSGPKSAPNSNSFWFRFRFNVCFRVFCAPNGTILFVYIPAKIKMSFNWKYIFFLPKFASSVSRSFAIFPRIVQAYIRPYSSGGSIKLITYQIRQELSVTIHKISTSWKNKR